MFLGYYLSQETNFIKQFNRKQKCLQPTKFGENKKSASKYEIIN